MRQRPLLFFICALSLLSYVSSDIYLPAFPALQEAFQTDKAYIETTLTTFLLGLAIGQLIYGVLSDALGRRKVLAAGLLLYTFASVLCAFSPNILILNIARFIQAMGVCSAAALWQAIIVDSYGVGKPRDKVFSIVIPVIALSPVFAPIIGGYLTAEIGWHAIFLLLALTGAGLFYITLFQFKETLLIENRKPFNFRHWLTEGGVLLRSRAFIVYMGVTVFATAGFFVYVTEIPFVFDGLGHDEKMIGYLFIPQTIVFIMGGLFSHWVAGKGLNKHTVLLGLSYFALVGCGILIYFSAFVQPYSFWQYVLPFCIPAFVNGALYPLAYALVYEAHGDIAGMVAGLGGFLLALIGFIATGAMALFSHHGAPAMAVLILISYVFVYALLLGKNHG